MITIVIPMAGEGRRFAEAGYDRPKPLVDVCGQPMIRRVIDSLIPSHLSVHWVLLTRPEHGITESMIHAPGRVTIVPVEHPTEGAACTVLLARDLIDERDPLLIANCDQYLEWDAAGFLGICNTSAADAGVVTFNSTNPHHSYVRVVDQWVTEVAEKRLISDNAVAGVYWWRHGRDFTRCAERMIAAGERVNGEFYITPVFTSLLAEGGRVLPWEIDVKRKHMLGTPEELSIFLQKVFAREVRL